MLLTSHPTWVRGLKHSLKRQTLELGLSHPTWVRGLKQASRTNGKRMAQSHPTWVRGLKHGKECAERMQTCRTLRGCVD